MLYKVNYLDYNSLDCDWFKKLLFSTNSFAKYPGYQTFFLAILRLASAAGHNKDMTDTRNCARKTSGIQGIYQVVIGQFVIGQFVIGQFVIGQFNKPITFKVVF